MLTSVFAALSATPLAPVAGPADEIGTVVIVTAMGVVVFGAILLAVTIRSRRHLE